ncbi:hypothetical protein EPUS_03574 [Endocarpon pusillum Z07020]|uniref:Uncharacterized protein n=1 Tax=Endocarpon pusillum (strain Z07020 / HMAS-L-300199) TaxID=1263415 RepID=U1FYM5_ENDPU|nr:uncharacterized protein EPUS_03574 [Endocarpon pusillum Z07020]ERF70022.1 hypothetical protein EPUS_03574 [Endocarpon pusillum Z07020]
MELGRSPHLETERKSSHKTKKRKHADSEQKTSSKKRKKQLDSNLHHVLDTPSKIPKSKTKSQSFNDAVQSPPSSPPVRATLPDPDHDISITDAPPITKGSLTPTSSPFHSTTLSLYLPIPAIALSPNTALPAMLTTHMTPLLLSYYPPLRGIVLSISNPILSSQKPLPHRPPAPPPSPNADEPSQTVLAHCADADGLSYAWLTVHDNVCSEGFVGLAVEMGGAGGGEAVGNKGEMRRKMKKIGVKRDGDGEEEEEEEEEEEGMVDTSQETLVNAVADGDQGQEEDGDGDGEGEIGYFQRGDGTRVHGSIRFRVVDCEIVPGHDRESWSLQIEGTLLSVDKEESVLQEERQKVLRRQGKAVMSGGLGSGPGSDRNGHVLSKS